jgi:hypothetical protein
MLKPSLQPAARVDLPTPKPLQVKKFLVQLFYDDATQFLLDDEGIRAHLERSLRGPVMSITGRGSIPAILVIRES